MYVSLTVGQIERLIESLKETANCPADSRLLEKLETELEREKKYLESPELDEIPF